MKKPPAELALLTPDSEGWRITGHGLSSQKAATLGEAAAAVPLGTRVHLALPCQAVLLERMTLPSTDRDELAGMVQLQLEKSLPFPIETVSSDFVVVESGENESTLVSATAEHAQLNSLCGPLRESGRLPEKITPFAMHVAAACPVNETVLAVYPEQGQLVLAVCEKSRLAWTHCMQMPDEATLREELPQMFLGAEMEGVPVSFSRVRLAEECAGLAAPFREYLEVPVDTVSFEGPLPEPAFNLVPDSWRADLARGERAAKLQQRIIIGVVGYVLLIVAGILYLSWLTAQSRKAAAKLAVEQPAIKFVQGRQAKWRALAPAIDPSRYAVEVLFQATQTLPPGEIRITEFDIQATQWRIVGEAPSASLVTDYVTKLKTKKELENYTIEWKLGQLLPNDHAPFTIYGKL